MVQTIIVMLVVLVAAVAAGIKLYRFFRRRGPNGVCHPDACASCPYHERPECEKKD
ncbi:MAG: FeoB-associated Cys-rich membrane protein [Spirochaetes bacterium]|nr:FeoB-associated Cys-rich membrane protein [Spirochaetota bacterium]